MKKLARSDVALDYVKLLAEHSKKSGIAEYSEQAIQQFGDDVQRRLTTSAKTGHRLRGLRAESLFLAVVAGIGKVALIKAEDSGDAYYSGEDIRIPDYRVYPGDGQIMLVEVKAARLGGSFQTSFKLSDNYVQQLRRYAAVTNGHLFFAIFWEEMAVWTLNRIEVFVAGVAGQTKWSLSFMRAFATNEMGRLGDCTVATRVPLRFRLMVDPNKSDPMRAGETGNFTLTLAGTQILSGDRVLQGLSAELAWKLVWYGTWNQHHQEAEHDDNRLLWVDHVFAPPDWEDDEQSEGMVPIGALSQMISTAYLRGAERTVHTNANDGVLEPGYMGNFIPSNFMELKLDLPLALFHFEPNFAFPAAVDAS